MRPTTIHTGAWRYPGAYPDANFNLWGGNKRRIGELPCRGRHRNFSC